jgi:oxygen-independent coproporphyrinogen-3 oxidase
MAGIYIHIPYCKQACHYCDFHFSVKKETKDVFVNSLLREISIQKNYIEGEKIETIYLGGGTPSLLSTDELKRIFEALHQNFEIDSDAEITLEANPDDLIREKISELKSSLVNRLSIGIQSFFDYHLKWMNRAHNSNEATESVKRAQDSGFENITIDLIYGLPDLTNADWEKNIETAFDLNVQHLSCYSLTVEPRTALAHFIASGKSKNLNEEQAAEQFEILIKRMKDHNWLHYEISNFSSEEKYISRHNSSYWKGEKYLGLGPSAHSFNGSSRQWNARNNHLYIDSLKMV